MYESKPGTILEWIAAVPGHIPEQAVMFENRSDGEAMFVANVHVRASNIAGSFVSSSTCAEYYMPASNEVGCLPTFDFLVLKHGESATICNGLCPMITMNTKYDFSGYNVLVSQYNSVACPIISMWNKTKQR